MEQVFFGDRYKKLIDSELHKIFIRLKKTQMPKILYNAMCYSVLNGGKRIRPILCLSVYDAINNRSKITRKNYKKILPFACGLELIHTFSLIQDDLPSMDNDDYRRGKLSLHKMYNEGVALLTADALFSLAFELFAKAPVSDRLKVRAINELTYISGINGLAGGQMMDLLQKKKQNLQIKVQNEINKKKTAVLIAGSIKIGAIAANASEQVIKRLQEVGINLGMLFQITDDIIDKNQTFNIKKLKSTKERLTNKLTEIFKQLGKNFDWLIKFQDYLLKRKA